MASNSIQELEKRYPEIAQEYKRIAGEQYSLFAAKMLDYGKGNISVGSNLETPEEAASLNNKEFIITLSVTWTLGLLTASFIPVVEAAA